MSAENVNPKSRTEKEPTDEEVFREFRLAVDSRDVFPNPAGDIPYRVMTTNKEGSGAIVWGIRKGSSYSPEAHSHGHKLVIEHGSGTISINGEERPYSVQNEFEIPPNVPHSFVRVDETTVVLEMRM